MDPPRYGESGGLPWVCRERNQALQPALRIGLERCAPSGTARFQPDWSRKGSERSLPAVATPTGVPEGGAREKRHHIAARRTDGHSETPPDACPPLIRR